MNKEIKFKRFVFITIAIAFLFWGFSCGVIAQPEQKEKVIEKEVEVEVEKEVIKEVEKEVKVEVCSNEKKWKELKKLDDEIIDLSSQALILAGDSFTAISEYDIDRMNSNMSKIEAMTPKVTEKSIKRQEILKDLGY